MSGFKYVEDPILGKGRAEFLGGGTGGTAYEAGTGIDSAQLENGTIAVSDIPQDSVSGLTDLADGTQSITKDTQNARHIGGATGTPLTLLHFSDIHADTAALARIVADGESLGTLIDGMICTGDITGNVAGQITSWWDADVMTCIGNHDTASYNGSYDWTALSMADRDAYYIAPFESNWGITHTSGTSYYYKDYTTQGVRLIVMDGMLYIGSSTTTEAAAQTAWLESLLADAVTNGLHVLIAVHAPHGGSTPVSCSFTKYGQGTMPTKADCNTPDAVINAVASAITSGLHFIGYLCGHTHQDAVWDATGDGTQLMYCITCANVYQTAQWRESDLARNTTLDAFNLVSVDTVHSIVKITRGGGANIDNRMRKRESLSVNYATGTVVDLERAPFASTADEADHATEADSATIALGAAGSMAGYRMEVDGGTMSMARFVPISTVSGSAVTMEAGHAYRIQAEGSSITLNTEAIPANTWGLDAHLELFTASPELIIAGENVRFNDTFSVGEWNSCTVRFVSGVATVYVDNVSTIYLVTQNSDLTKGSLYFGLTDSSVSNKNYISVSNSLDGQTISFGGATVTTEKHIVGNGASLTILTGSVGAGGSGYVDMTDCALSGVVLTGGKVGFGDVAITDGATVTLTSGTLALGGAVSGSSGTLVASSGTIIDLTGNQNASVIPYSETNNVMFGAGGVTVYPVSGQTDSYLVGGITLHSLGNTNVVDFVQSGHTGAVGNDIVLSGMTFCNGYVSGGNVGGGLLYMTSGSVVANDCVFSGGSAPGAYGAGINFASSAGFMLTSCTIAGCTGGIGGGLAKGAGTMISGTLSNCVITRNAAQGQGGGIYCTGILDIIGTEICSNTTKTAGGAISTTGGTINLISCSIYGNTDQSGAIYIANSGKVTISGTTIALTQRINLVSANTSVTFVGSNFIGKQVYGAGVCHISSGAILDFTGNTSAAVINPTGGIVVSEGGCTVINSAGASVAIAGGTYTQINKDGTTA